MESNQFKELINNFYTSNEQLEKALEIMTEYSKNQKKVENISSELIERISQDKTPEIIDISEKIIKYIDLSSKQINSMETSLQSLSSDINDIKSKIADMEVSLGTIMKNTEVINQVLAFKDEILEK